MEMGSIEQATSTSSNKLESKYKAELRNITTNFELYKKEAQQNLQSLREDKT